MKFVSLSGSQPDNTLLKGVVFEGIYHDNDLVGVLISDARGRLLKITENPAKKNGLRMYVMANPLVEHNGGGGGPVDDLDGGNGGGGMPIDPQPTNGKVNGSANQPTCNED